MCGGIEDGRVKYLLYISVSPNLGQHVIVG